MADLEREIDDLQLAERGEPPRPAPTSPAPPAPVKPKQSLADLESKLLKLRQAWTSLDDAETAAIDEVKLRYANDEQMKHEKTQKVLAQYEPAKQVVMEQRLEMQAQIEALRKAP
jgi:hypothetical protein